MHLLSRAHFSKAFRGAQRAVPFKNIMATTRKDLFDQIVKKPGVYLVFDHKELLYIGSAGKISSRGCPNGSTIYKRLRFSYTPYNFFEHSFRFQPKSTRKNGKPMGYLSSRRISDLKLTLFETPQRLAPACLEYYLLQSYLNQYGRLPIANQVT